MGYSTPKKQLDLKEFLAQPAKKHQMRTGMTFRKPGGKAAGSTVATVQPSDTEADTSAG